MASAQFVVGLCVSALLAVSVQALCPDIRVNNSCSSGSCRTGGNPGTWKIPNLNNLDCEDGTCDYKKSLKEDDELGTVQDVKVSVKKTAGKCCKQCKNDKLCKYWLWVNLGSKGGMCFRYSGGGPTCSTTLKARSNAGAKCQTQVIDDPHLVGAHGAHFDFSGQPDKSFCLVSDRTLHLNMKMTGYLDERLESATLVKDGKAVRTWIREVGVLWTAEGVEHKLRLGARAGGETARGEGFLAVAELDSAALPRLEVGDELALEGGLNIKFEAIEKKGAYDVDFYTVKIGDILDVDVRLRAANPLLQRPEDAEVHISLGINSIKNTDAIHGVLGQTYRSGREARAEEFNKVVAALHRNVGADTAEGQGLLDGQPADYISSDVLAADCHYSAYSGLTPLQVSASSE